MTFFRRRAYLFAAGVTALTAAFNASAQEPPPPPPPPLSSIAAEPAPAAVASPDAPTISSGRYVPPRTEPVFFPEVAQGGDPDSALDERPIRPPEDLPKKEGENPPEGYHLQKNFQRWPFSVGPVFFTVAYQLALGSLIIGNNQAGFGGPFDPLLIPVAGPFITLETAKRSFSNDIDAVLLVTLGVFQSVGVGLTIGGFFFPKREHFEMDDRVKRDWNRREREWKMRQEERKRRTVRSAGLEQWKITPMAGPQSAGAVLTGAW